MMTKNNIPQKSRKFEVEAFKRAKNTEELKRTHVPFAGSPLKHPLDSKMVILVPDPYTSPPFYYEFKKEDVAFADKLPNVVNAKGKTVTMVRLWVKKMSVGTICTPFVVEEAKLKI